MRSFVGTHENRLDAKGRVSIPAPFRTALRAVPDPDTPATLMLRPSHKHGCVECWPAATFERLVRSLDGMDPLSDEYDDRSTVIFGETTELDLDREGRIVLTPAVVEFVGVTDRVAFMGMGDTFHLWEPEALKRRREDARTRARLHDSARPNGTRPATAEPA